MNKTLPESFHPQLEAELIGYLTKNFGPEVFSPGLERTKPIYKPFIEFFRKHGVKVITIAGTNGKGQTAHTLGGFFNQQSVGFALWTSPHILSIRERFCLGHLGKIREITYEELKKALHESELLLKNSFPDVRVSFYEFLFFAFLHWAKKQNGLDYLILEVGLGGRLDAVNHFDADCACITSISRDHQAILGFRLDQILSEKIAVARRGALLLTNFKLAYLNEKTGDYARREGVIWRSLTSQENSESYFEDNQKMAWEIFNHFYPHNGQDFKKAISLLPAYKGRREIMTFKGKSLIFIGAHNIDGVRRMLEGFERSVENSLESGTKKFPGQVLISFSQRPENEVIIMLKALMEFFQGKSTLLLTSFDHPKALSSEVLQSITKKVNKGMLNFVPDWKVFLKEENTEDSPILVCGSYYFIGEIQRFIGL